MEIAILVFLILCGLTLHIICMELIKNHMTKVFKNLKRNNYEKNNFNTKKQKGTR